MNVAARGNELWPFFFVIGAPSLPSSIDED